MTLPRAEEIAANGLAFLAADAARLTGFLAATGLSPHVLRRDAASPRMLAAVLAHLADDESLLLTFAASTGIPPADIAPARDALQMARGDKA